MLKPAPFGLAAITILCGLAAAAFTTDRAGVRAQGFESPLEFSVRQQRQRRGEHPAYAREPRPVHRPGGLFGALFGFDFFEPPPPRRAAHRELKRAVCRRSCDGAQIVLGFVSSRRQEKDAEAMCAVAGSGAPTEFALEKFVPGAGFAPPQVASASEPLFEGRASLSAEPPAPRTAGGGCAREDEPMIVPILHDSTLRKGDIVATKSGFRVFVGRGRPPFKEADFAPLDMDGRLGATLRTTKIADR